MQNRSPFLRALIAFVLTANANSWAAAITYPQFVLGGGFQCVLLVSNTSDSEWQGTARLRQGNAQNWSSSWTLNGADRTGSASFEFALQPKATRKFVQASESADPSVGYLVIEGDAGSPSQAVAVSFFYNLVQESGLVDSIGTPASDPSTIFSLPVEKTEAIDTGIAWAPFSMTSPFELTMRLFDEQGVQSQQSAVLFQGHQARFFSELFENVPFGFRGQIQVESEHPITMTALRLETAASGTQLTSIPPNADDASSMPLAALSDDFTGGALGSAWQIVNPEMVNIAVEDEALHLEPGNRTLWFNARQGPFIWKAVSGDFSATSTVRVRRISDPSLPPEVQFQLGGLMARNPDSTSENENYVFIVIGADGNDVSVETKTTVNSSSSFIGPPWPSGEGQLRICRRGATFRLYIREIGDSNWELANTFERPDLPNRLQVGPMAYANRGTADLRASFGEVEFFRITKEDQCLED